MIHQQQPEDAVAFLRQKHGGSAFDSKRGRLVLFGSDTHSRDDWTNSPLIFDLESLSWSRLYPDDERRSYRVSADGLPVAGPNGTHPWAMHTYGAVTYDPAADALVVASLPKHMEPGRFTNALAAVWPEVRRHPTWILDLASGRWRALDAAPVHFFPRATAFDPKRGRTLGLRGDGVHGLSLAEGRWRRLGDGGLLGWGNNVAYDAGNDTLVAFGSHKWGNEVVVFEPSAGRAQVRTTPGLRPPGAKYPPMAYHPGLGRTVVLVDRHPDPDKKSRRTARAETWLYDAAADAWTQVEGAELPFGVAMNYNLEYDPGRDLLLLVADPPGEAVAVWALKL